MLRALAFFLCILAAPVAAQCTGPSIVDRLTDDERRALDSAVADMPFASGLFWQAERDGRRINIAGTMHISDPRLDPVLDRLRPVVATSDLLLLEMTPPEQAQMQQALARDPSVMFLPDGTTLPGMLDAPTWDRIAAAANDRNIPPLMAEQLRPWFLILSLSMPTCAMGYLADAENGLDQRLMALAEADAIPMQALEPWNAIFTLLNDTSLDQQLDLLRLGVLEGPLQEEMFVAMIDGYFAGNIAEVRELSRLSLGYIPGIDATGAAALFEMLDAVLLEDRTAAWIPVIEQAAATNATITVAVGAAHLPGDAGLLALLQGRGWTVTPLP